MIKLFEEYSRDRLGDIEDIFQSFIEDEFGLNVLCCKCEESKIKVKTPIKYRKDREYSWTNVVYRYVPNKDTDWADANREVYQDGGGYNVDVRNFFINTTIEEETENISKNDYYSIEISGDNNIIIDNWESILDSIRNFIIQLDMDLYKCGDLSFRNGIEIAYELTEVDWISLDYHEELDLDSYRDIHNLTIKLNICLK